ncbi:MAG: VanZ family protein [Candidatus Cloacimonetes bacterium]|nr:VanZ family protein [Candidatus Cloacimonadota bacterium]
MDQLNLDKAAHLGVYLILGLLSNRVLTGYRKGLLFTIMIYAVLLLSAALDEYHQVWVTNRMVSVYDMFANQLGLLIGLTIYMLYDRRKRP